MFPQPQTLHERISWFRKSNNLTQKEFAEVLDFSQAYISSLEKGKREASAEVIKVLMDKYQVSPNWLLTGSGSPILQHDVALAPDIESSAVNQGPGLPYVDGSKERILPITVDANNEPNIVLVPVKAQAGYALERVNPEFVQDLPAFRLPNARFQQGTFRAFEVAGDSMEPTLFGNDIVVCRHIQDWRWLRELELYVVVMPEDVLIKRVRNEITTREQLTLISDNAFYPPFSVPVAQLHEVWQVVARLTLHLPAPPKG